MELDYTFQKVLFRYEWMKRITTSQRLATIYNSFEYSLIKEYEGIMKINLKERFLD